MKLGDRDAKDDTDDDDDVDFMRAYDASTARCRALAKELKVFFFNRYETSSSSSTTTTTRTTSAPSMRAVSSASSSHASWKVAYEGFRSRAMSYQTGETDAKSFAETLASTFRADARRDAALARETVRTIPSRAKRVALRRALGGRFAGDDGDDVCDNRNDEDEHENVRCVDDDGTCGGTTLKFKKKATAMKIEQFGDGLVCLRKFLDADTQARLAEKAFEAGESDAESAAAGKGFFARDEKNDGMFKLNQGSRGRVILSVDDFAPALADTESFDLRATCARAVEVARAVDGTMPKFNPTTVLVNFYKDGAEFKWHKDSEDPKLIKTKTGPPIVSFSVGLSADFGYKYSFEDPEHKVIKLNSGDVLLFGGPSRMIVHSVLNVHPGSMPGHLRGKMLNGRLNVTVRDVGTGVIDVSQFPAYRVSYDGVTAEGNV